MKTVMPWLALIFFLGCLALGGFILHQNTELAQAAADRGAVEKETQKKADDLEHQMAALKADHPAATETAALQPAPPPRPPLTAAVNPGVRTIHVSDIIKDHPEYAALYARQQRENMLRQYGNVLNSLNLPPDQLARLKDLLVERQASATDAVQVAGDVGVQQGPDVQAAVKQATQEVDQQINAILANSGSVTSFPQLQVMTNMQNQVQNTYAPDMIDAGVPMSAQQSAALAQAMLDANYSLTPAQRPAGYNQGDPTTGLTPHQEQILSGAAQALSPAQIQIVQTDQLQANQQAVIMKKIAASGATVVP